MREWPAGGHGLPHFLGLTASPASASTVELAAMSGEDLNAHTKIRKLPAATWYEIASST
jgi:hypothetical protein